MNPLLVGWTIPPRPRRPRPPGARVSRIDLIGPITAESAVAIFHAIDAAAGDTITMVVDSEGGAAIPALGIFDALIRRRHRVVADIVGRASSAAATAAMGADRRRIAPRGSFMLHGTAGGPEEWRAHFDSVADQIVAAATGQRLDVVEAWRATGWTFNAAEALRAGLAHHLMETPR